MADISKITLPSGNTYNIKDTTARSSISSIQSAITGGIHYRGETTTALTNAAATNPVKIGGSNYTAVSGDLVTCGQLEFIFSDVDGKWHEFGSTGSLKALAFKDNASADYKPAGTVSKPTITVTPNNATVNSITDVGTLPAFTATVSGEVLTLGFSAGTLPTKGADTTVVTSIKSATATQPKFTGTEATITVS